MPVHDLSRLIVEECKDGLESSVVHNAELRGRISWVGTRDPEVVDIGLGKSDEIGIEANDTGSVEGSRDILIIVVLIRDSPKGNPTVLETSSVSLSCLRGSTSGSGHCLGKRSMRSVNLINCVKIKGEFRLLQTIKEEL